MTCQSSFDAAEKPIHLPIEEQIRRASENGEVGLLVEDMGWSVMLPLQAVNPALVDFVLRSVTPNVQHLADLVRKSGGPVVWIGPTGTPDGTDHNDLISGLAVDSADYSVRRDSASAFWHSNVDAILRNRGVTCLLVSGWGTNHAVLVDAADGSHRGYSVTIVSDACAAETPQEHAATLEAHPEQFAVLSTADVTEAITASSETVSELGR